MTLDNSLGKNFPDNPCGVSTVCTIPNPHPPPLSLTVLGYLFFFIDLVVEYGMKQISYLFGLILIIKTQTNNQTNVNLYEVKVEIYRVKHVIYGVKSEHKICFGAALSHTKRFGHGD